jgi:glycosyltransferase involved in cell wall biosynthesis
MRGRCADRMNILNVNHLIDPESGGGTAERTVQLSRSLVAAGAVVEVLALDIGVTATCRAALAGIRLTAIPCANRRFFVPHFPWPEIEAAVVRADVVQLSGHWTLLNVLVRNECRRLGKPYVFCPAGALRVVGRSRWLKLLYDAVAGKAIARDARVCIGITDDERADFIRYGVSAEKVEVISNGIDPAEYETPDPAESDQEVRAKFSICAAPFVLFLGRLNWIKGPDLLLEAYCRVAAATPNVHLVLAGPDGGMLTQLQEAAAVSGFKERIHFPGYLAGDKKQAALRQAAMLAIPSRREAMSIVVLEAGIVCTPVLFTDTCGLADFASAGAGTMVPPTVDGLEHGLRAVLADPESAGAGAVRLQKCVRSDYLWMHQARRYLALYERLLSGSKR